MNCPKCNFQNQEGAKFCTKCGNILLKKDRMILPLSLLITFFLFVVSIFIQVKLWAYFYSIGLSDTAPHGENLGQGSIIFLPEIIFFFILSKFFVTKLLKNPRTTIKITIAIAGILVIAFGAFILFFPKNIPQTLFTMGRYRQLMRDYPDFARKPEVYSVMKSYYLTDKKNSYEDYIITTSLEQLLKVNPDDLEVKNRLVQESLSRGAFYYNENQLDYAINAFEIAVKYEPKQPTAYIYLGLTYEKKGETDKAIKQYQTALQLDPNNQRIKEGLERLQTR